MARLRVGTGLAALIFAFGLLYQATPAGAGCAGIAMSCRPPNYPALKNARSEAGHLYGSLAYSKRNGAFGWSTGFGDSDSADQVALENCGKRGPGCYVVISFSNLCAAVAADDSGGVFWGTAGTKLEAQRQSMLYCKRDGDAGSCEIKVWACSY